MFRSIQPSPLFPAPPEPFDAWLDAEWLVCARWAEYLAAGAEDRPFAFAAYTAALDAEGAAARALEAIALPEAA